MERKVINDLDLDKVVGGSIIFNGDHTTCGRKNNAEYKVLDYNAVLNYIKSNTGKMAEKTMMSNMVAAGLLAKL